MNRFKKWILLFLLFTSGCSQMEVHTEKPITSQKNSLIPVTIHAVRKDGSPVEGAGVGFLYLDPVITTSTEGRLTDQNGEHLLQLREGAKVRIEVSFYQGDQVKNLTKEIIISSKERDIFFVKP